MLPVSAKEAQELPAAADPNHPYGEVARADVVGGGSSAGPNGDLDEVAQELYDPHDDWAARDLLLSLMPYAIATALRDSAFHPGLIFATVLSWLLLFARLVFWDGRHKIVLPMLDMTNVVLFTVLLGFSYRHESEIHKWYNIISAGAFAVVILLSVLCMRGFTGHYARYSKLDAGGVALWAEDVAWRHACAHSSIAFGVAFAMATAFSLLPVLTNHFHGTNALNIAFNYVVPLLFPLVALLYTHQVVGKHYLQHSSRNRPRVELRV